MGWMGGRRGSGFPQGRVDGVMGGWVDGWMGGWVDGWMGGRRGAASRSAVPFSKSRVGVMGWMGAALSLSKGGRRVSQATWNAKRVQRT